MADSADAVDQQRGFGATKSLASGNALSGVPPWAFASLAQYVRDLTGFFGFGGLDTKIEPTAPKLHPIMMDGNIWQNRLDCRVKVSRRGDYIHVGIGVALGQNK